MAHYEVPRRQLLAGFGGITSLSVAGCTGTEGDDERPNGSPDDNGDPSEEDSDTSSSSADIPDSIRTANEHLGDAADRFESETEDLDQSEFRTSDIHALLDRATEEFDTAHSEATTEQRDAIETTKSIGEWLRHGVEALESYGEAVANLETGGTYYDNERFQEAADRAETARTVFEESSASLDDADAVYERLELATLEAIDEDPDEIRSELEILDTRMEELNRYIDTMNTFASARRHLAVGTEQYVNGTEAVDEDRFADAIAPLEEAQTEFESANSLSRDGEENAPQELLEEFLLLTCMTENLREAADQMHIAVMEADAGNMDEAGEAYDAALSAEEAAEEC